MGPLEYLRSLTDNVKRSIPAPARRMAGQVWRSIPVQLNPLRTSTPATLLGKIGKHTNPLSPGSIPNILGASIIAELLGGKTAAEGVGFVASASNPVWTALSLSGSSPISEDPYGNWKNLGYSSRYEMIKRVAAQAELEGKGQLALNKENRLPGVIYGGYVDPLLSDYGPPTPLVNIPGSRAYNSYMASQRTTAPNPTAGPRVDASTTQMIDIGSPAPRQAPRLVPVTPASPPDPVISQAAYTAAQTKFRAPTDIPLSEFYAAQKGIGQYAEQGGELQRRLKEAGGVAGMSDAALMEWVRANPALAYRELVRREKRPMPSVD